MVNQSGFQKLPNSISVFRGALNPDILGSQCETMSAQMDKEQLVIPQKNFQNPALRTCQLSIFRLDIQIEKNAREFK
jgi:hypothetical protein